MTAGLVTYRLCDRDFDCEHCPLDAALRGRSTASFGSLRGQPAGAERYTPCFPADRRYTAGHLWLDDGSPLPPGVVRVGVDALAASLVTECRGLRTLPGGSSVAAGQTCCELDLGCGLVPLSAPIGGRVMAGNPTLEDSPELLGARPYDEGWLLELEPRPESPAPFTGSNRPDGLIDAAAAEEQARLDLRRFRRRVALHLLTRDPRELASPEGSSPVGPTLADGGVSLTDVRQMLGARRWLAVLRELIH